MSSDCNKTSRRDLFRMLGRGAGLAGLATLGVVLGAREGDASCIANGACRTCRILGRCDLPEAHSTRQQKRDAKVNLKPADERSESAGPPHQKPQP
jgi:hypothetical protein